MNQRDTAALPWADLDPGSGKTVVVPFPQRARTPSVPPSSSADPTRPPADAVIAAEHYRESMQALRTACRNLSELLESVSASARSLEHSCRDFDERLQAIGTYGGQVANSGDALTTAIKRFRKRLVAAVLSDE